MKKSSIGRESTDWLPKVAVLMAAYNGSSWIAEQVESILAQEGVEVTLFISVDRSTDGTYEWCRELASRRGDVELLRYGARFGSAGPNFYRLIRDCELSSFDAIALADQDDVWLEWKLSHALETMRLQKVDAVSSDVIAFWADGRRKRIRKSWPQRQFDHFFESAGPGCTYVFSRSSMGKLQDFVRNLGVAVETVELHDWLIYAFFRHNGLRWFIDGEPSVLYRQHGRNQFGSNIGGRALFKRFQLVRKKWYRQQVGSITRLVAPELEAKLISQRFMISNYSQLRRRRRDQLVLLGMCLLRLF